MTQYWTSNIVIVYEQHSICGFVRTQFYFIFSLFWFILFDANAIVRIADEYHWNPSWFRNFDFYEKNKSETDVKPEKWRKKRGKRSIVISYLLFSFIQSRNLHYLIFNEKQAGCLIFNCQCSICASKILEDFISFHVDHRMKIEEYINGEFIQQNEIPWDVKNSWRWSHEAVSGCINWITNGPPITRAVL